MSNQHRWVADIAFELEKQGWMTRRGSKHTVVYPADKTIGPFTISNTPSDNYAQKNAIKQLRKAGAKI